MPANKLTTYILGLIVASAAGAEETDWQLCGESTIQAAVVGPAEEDSYIHLKSNQANFDLNASSQLTLKSNQANFDLNASSQLTGNVEARQDSQYLRADYADYIHKDAYLRAQGNVLFSDQGLNLSGNLAELYLDSKQARFDKPEYSFAPLHARGAANQIRRPSQDLLILDNATYTTCNPGSNDWLLSANRITLDRETGDGTGHGVVVRFMHIPFMYTPWIRFPIDERRKSGLLAPRVGYSNDSGAELEIPYYWNIAPNLDATLAARYLSKRGAQFKPEFRYLTQNNSGIVNLEYLDDDDYGDERYFAVLKHQSKLPLHFTGNLDYKKVSDENYFEDLGNSLSIASTTHLERQANLRYSDAYWRFMARVQDYQTLDESITEASRPYRRLPEISLDGRFLDGPAGFDVLWESEWVSFDRDQRVMGDRYDLALTLKRPFVAPGYFLTPAVSWRETGYKLENIEGTAFASEASPRRGLPVASLDSGLIFERIAANGNSAQTLEPRLHYLYVPFENQADIPLFDTSELDFSFTQLFRNNRFSNADRLADANQLSAALTTRFIDLGDGHQTFSASVGQIFYFEDRKVTLNNTAPIETHRSDLAAELSLNLHDRWLAQAGMLRDTELEQTSRSSVRLRYQSEQNRIINLAHRYRRDDFEQTDLAFAWPLGQRWRILGRWNYDLIEERDLEALAGIEYESCCWTFRVAGRRYLNDSEDEYNESIQAQLILKGLSQIGSPLGELLESGILGYESDY